MSLLGRVGCPHQFLMTYFAVSRAFERRGRRWEVRGRVFLSMSMETLDLSVALAGR